MCKPPALKYSFKATAGIRLSFSVVNPLSSGIFWPVRSGPHPGSAAERTSPLAGTCTLLHLVDVLLFHPIEVRGPAAVLPVARQDLHPSQPCQIRQRPLDGGPGEAEVPGNAPNGIPTLPLPVGPVLEVEEDGLGPGTQILVPVDAVKVTHSTPPPVL